MRREALKVERCTLNVGRPRGGALRRVGMRREALKVARCTLNVGRPRGGAQRRCARTGGGGHRGGGARGERCKVR